jgi:hypothetical protein
VTKPTINPTRSGLLSIKGKPEIHKPAIIKPATGITTAADFMMFSYVIKQRGTTRPARGNANPGGKSSVVKNNNYQMKPAGEEKPGRVFASESRS